MRIPNVVQFTGTTPTISALNYSNFYLGVQNQNYGPTSLTGFWNGISVPSGGYVLYLDKPTQGPSIYVITNEQGGFSLCEQIFGTSQFITNFYGYLINRWGSNVFLNKNYENIITDDLYICLDPSIYLCNPNTGGTPSQIKNITTPEIFGGNNLNNSAEVNDNGNYFSFDGVSDQILFLDAGFVNPQLRFTGDVSYEFFIRLKDLTGGTSQLYNKSSVNEGVISANTSNKLVYSYGNGLGSQTFETTTTLTNSTWYHVVLVRDLTNTQKIYWYLNGIEDRNTTSTYSSAGTSVNNTYLMSDGSSDYTLADVGVIRIYNSALTAAQVSQNFNTQKSRFGL